MRSFGEYFLLECGVARYRSRKANKDFRQLLWSTVAHLMRLLIEAMRRSHVELACGHSGVINWCLNPDFIAKFLNSDDMKAGPLSLLIVSGIPNVLKTVERILMT
jgi:hypothetical protein